MNNEAKIQAAKEVFESNPSIHEVHVTNDGQCFLTPGSATNHEKEVSGKRILDAEDRPLMVTRTEACEPQPKKLSKAEQKEADEAAKLAEQEAAAEAEKLANQKLVDDAEAEKLAKQKEADDVAKSETQKNEASDENKVKSKTK